MYLEKTALNGGQLEIVGVPFGEYTADKLTTDNPNDQKNSVYSRAAAIERKIEIQSVSYLEQDSLFFLVDLEPRSLVLGKITTKTVKPFELKMQNNGSQSLFLERIEIQDSLFSVQAPNVLASNSMEKIIFTPQKELPKGFFYVPVDVYFKTFKNPIRVMVLGEGSE
jgi:hypothetical protein